MPLRRIQNPKSRSYRFYQGEFGTATELQLRIQPNLTAAAVEKGAYNTLNAGFWLGTLIASRMAEGTVAQDLEKKPTSDQALRVAKINLGMWAASAIVGNTMVDVLHRPEGLLVLIGAMGGGNTWVWRKRKQSQMNEEEYMQKKYMTTGEELAEKYPALSFDMLPS